MDVALVSCRVLPEPDPDQQPLSDALAAAGIEAAVLGWDDPEVDWSVAGLTVLRSAWNYPLDRDGFLAWAERVDGVSRLLNELPVVCWNSHKRYLLDLGRHGVPVTPTVLLPRGSIAALGAILAERGWTEAVVKPAVSAASFRTLRVSPADREAGEAHLQALLAERDVLVQRYMPSVEDHGERALVFIDGELTHAVRKSPRFEGDDEAVSADPVPFSEAEADLARHALAAVDGPLLYARVDVAPGPEGRPVVMELELVEPSLFLRQSAAALERFVAAIRARLNRPA
jgi:hypothetical protein